MVDRMLSLELVLLKRYKSAASPIYHAPLRRRLLFRRFGNHCFTTLEGEHLTIGTRFDRQNHQRRRGTHHNRNKI